MMKPDSLYNAGMKPLLYSEKQAKLKSNPFFFINRYWMVQRWAGRLLLLKQSQKKKRWILLYFDFRMQIPL